MRVIALFTQKQCRILAVHCFLMIYKNAVTSLRFIQSCNIKYADIKRGPRDTDQASTTSNFVDSYQKT